MMRGTALSWLFVLAPIEMATTLARLTSMGLTSVGTTGVALVVARALVVTAGVVLGRQLWQRESGARPLAIAWAVGDLVTLAIVLASSALPTSRPPGAAPMVWLAYAAMAGIVLAVAARDASATDGPGSAD